MCSNSLRNAFGVFDACAEMDTFARAHRLSVFDACVQMDTLERVQQHKRIKLMCQMGYVHERVCVCVYVMLLLECMCQNGDMCMCVARVYGTQLSEWRHVR